MKEFRKYTGRNKKPQVWKIYIDQNKPDTYIVEWGVLNGLMQKTSDTPGSCGVKGHLDYQTPEQYVVFCMNREIRKKEEQGYVEYINNKPVKEVATSIDFSKPLPKNLCFNKPKKEVPDRKLIALKDKALWTIKRDGLMHIAVKSQGLWEIYSRRIDLATEKFPHIVEALENLNFPNNTILLGEMVFIDNDKDNFVATTRVCRSDPDLALAYQGLGLFPKDAKNENVIGKLSYYVFDLAFFNGKDLISNISIGERIRKLKSLFPNKPELEMLKTDYISPVQIVSTNAKDDLELAKRMGIEGFVVLNRSAIYGDKAYSFDGKAQRPEGCWKRKPKFEEEFVISGLYEGAGRNRGKLGGFYITQIHPKTNQIIQCGKCGGGFSDEQRVKLNDKNLIGQTIKVEFDSRQPPRDGAYALRFPIFKGLADKSADECVAQFLGMKK